MLSVRDMSFSRGGKHILRHISFDMHAGEKVVLLGLNGSGKTTLLKIVNGLYFCEDGEVRFEGTLIDKAHFTRNIEENFRQKSCMLFQNYDSMFFCKSIYDDIAFSPRRYRLDDIDARVTRAAQLMGVEKLLEELPFNVSGGEKQRAALACLLALNHTMLLLDEPTSALDPQWVGKLVDIMQASTSAALIATHNLSLAKELADRAIVLKDGEIVYDGETKRFLHSAELLEKAGMMHSHIHEATGEPHFHNWN